MDCYFNSGIKKHNKKENFERSVRRKNWNGMKNKKKKNIKKLM